MPPQTFPLRDMRMVVDDRPDEGIFQVHPALFASAELFELEQRYVFERTWNFLALESQFPKPNDFVSAWIARTPILVTRAADGAIHAHLNACRHKGAMVCRAAQGNTRYHVCPYHGWAYDATGKNVDIKDSKDGCYSAAFQAENHALVPLARVASYKGLVFGSLSPDVPPLKDFLGELGFFIDLAMEQSPHGMEFVPGRAIYTYAGNWKLQMDNGIDQYHLTSTHASFLQVQDRRRAGEGHQEARQFDWQMRFSQEGGMYQFDHGHAAIWLHQPEASKRPIYPAIGEIRSRLGDVRADWILKLRNTIVFPNMQIADSTSLLLRTFRPLAVNRTEMRVYCLAPIGEAPDARTWRLRQFEDFFNPSGFATPDDTVIYEECQQGLGARGMPFLQGYSRGMTATEAGPNNYAHDLGFQPVASLKGPFGISTETCFHPAYREWARLMQAGIDGRKAYPAGA